MLLLFATLVNTQNVTKVEVKVTMPSEQMPEIFHAIRSLTNLDTQINIQSIEQGESVIQHAKKHPGILIADMAHTDELRKANLIRPLNGIISQSIIEKINPSFLEGCHDEHNLLYALPVCRSMPIIYYNMDIIRSLCGMEDFSKKDIPTTWEEMEKFLHLCRLDYDEEPLQLGGDFYDWIFHATVLSYGGSLIDESGQLVFNSPAVIEALDMWRKMKANGLLNTYYNWDATINKFKDGGLPIICFSTEGLVTTMNDANFNWEVGMMPKQEKQVVNYGGANMFLSSTLTNTEIMHANVFIEMFYTATMQAQIFSKVGASPVILGAANESELQLLASSPQYKDAQEQLQYAVDTPNSNKHSEIRALLRNTIIEALDENNTTSTEDLLNIAQKRAQIILSP